MRQTTRPIWLDWATLIGLAVTVLGATLVVGQSREQINDNTRRIGQLEAKVEKIDEINARTARIEGKIDALSPTAGGH